MQSKFFQGCHLSTIYELYFVSQAESHSEGSFPDAEFDNITPNLVEPCRPQGSVSCSLNWNSVVSRGHQIYSDLVSEIHPHTAS